MRVKLDENMPTSAAALLRPFGHDVDTVREEGLLGANDDVVAEAAGKAGRMLITLDRGFSELAIHPGASPGLVVLRPFSQRVDHVAAALADLLDKHSLDELSGCTVIAGIGRIRVRRPG